MRRALCPNCREVELVAVRTEVAVVEECPKCRGIWFDAEGEELRRVLALGVNRLTEELRAAPAAVEKAEAAGRIPEGPDRACP